MMPSEVHHCECAICQQEAVHPEQAHHRRINEEDMLALHGECVAYVHREGRFAYATFEVQNTNLSHRIPF